MYEMLDRTFTTALLLTGSAERAEEAILESIRSLELDDAPVDALFRGAVNASIQPRNEIAEQRREELEHASSILPAELRRVLLLPQDLRHCYVLRLLAGFPREDCASLLHSEIHQVDEGTCTAAQALARMS
jgi:hypothetical protein